MGTGTASQETGGGHLGTLDALRGIAAACVMLHHAQFFYGRPGLFAHAYVAVDFFFLLSGFVLTLRYEPTLRFGISPSRFLRLRVARLWPTIAMGVGFGAVVTLLDGVASAPVLAQTMLQLAFVPIFAGQLPVYPLNGAQWSLLVEIVANAVHAAILHRLSDRAAWLLVVLAAVGVLIVAHEHGSLAVGDTGRTWTGGLVRVGFSYLCGMLLARLHARRVPRRAVPAVLPLVALPAIFWIGTLPIGGRWYFDPLLAILVFPAILWSAGAVRLSPPGIALAAAAGAISYPLYAFHLPFIRAGELLAGALPHGWVDGARIAALAACIATAWSWARWQATAVPRRRRTHPHAEPVEV